MKPMAGERRTSTNARPYRASLFRFWLLVIGSVVLAGCQSGGAKLMLKSTVADRQYVQTFHQALFSRDSGGEYNVVLIEDGISTAPARRAGPITSSQASPISQVFQIRIRWRPLRGSKPDTPSATNAVIDWYVRSSDGAGDHLHYRGAGFVAVYDSTTEARFDIRSARVELAGSVGRLRDPLGESTLTGSFVARRNDRLVASILDGLRNDLAAGQSSGVGAHAGPPPRAAFEP